MLGIFDRFRYCYVSGKEKGPFTDTAESQAHSEPILSQLALLCYVLFFRRHHYVNGILISRGVKVCQSDFSYFLSNFPVSQKVSDPQVEQKLEHQAMDNKYQSVLLQSL